METMPFLNKFYTIRDFHKLSVVMYILEWGRIFDLYLPTARVFTTPELSIPKVARAYTTSHYYMGGRIVSYDDMRAKRIAESGTFKGSAYEKAVTLFEYWEDKGSDGHIAYRHSGYIFSTLTLSDSTYPEHSLQDLYFNSKAEEETS